MVTFSGSAPAPKKRSNFGQSAIESSLQLMSSTSWRDAWKNLGVPEPAGLLNALIARYSEPHRAYHNLRHIEECFAALAHAAHLAERLPEVQLALWFHDAIYDPRASDNEQASAELAHESLIRSGADAESANRIHELIMATRHEAPVEPVDARLVSDVDLAILAAPTARFLEYQAQIRLEYSWMPKAEFQRRRTSILRGFLERTSIYQTEWFAARLENAARANIARELGVS
jgi:predicted metal-dependent HD superfamily phosphohydrolase